MNLASILVSLPLFVPQAATEKTSKGDLKITPITHGTLMFEYGGKVIHVDPAQTDLTKYPKADWIFITDIHGDHFDPKAIDTVKKAGTKIVAPTVVAEKIAGAAVMKNGETKDIDGIRVEGISEFGFRISDLGTSLNRRGSPNPQSEFRNP